MAAAASCLAGLELVLLGQLLDEALHVGAALLVVVLIVVCWDGGGR